MEISELKSLLSRLHLRPDKKLGQNFLLSETVLDEIVEAADLTSQDEVLEIGPGLGFLTSRLAEKSGKVLAIEKDRRFIQALRKILKRHKNVKVIQGDVLKLSTVYSAQYTDFKIVANIPYYITGMLLQKFLEAHHKPVLMVLLLQKEVAERIVAKPGEMSILSVSIQFYADPQIIDFVEKDSFYPQPEVDSAILKLNILAKPKFEVDQKKFFQLVKIGFSNKRKQLHNNLQAGLGLGRDGKEILESLGLNPLARAQDLSLDDWQKLYERLIGN